MRHRKKTNNLSRSSAHRKAMVANMACSLITHKRINTTVAKAKVLRTFVEPLITKSKTDSTHSRRIVFSQLQDKHAVSELFRDIAPRVGDRPGGYTRIIKTGFRQGDAADMCMIELVDFNDVYVKEKKAAKKTRRSRRGGGTGGTQAAPATEAPAAEAVVEEATPEVKGETPAAEVKAEAAPEAEAKAEEPAADDEKKTSKEEGDTDPGEEKSA